MNGMMMSVSRLCVSVCVYASVRWYALGRSEAVQQWLRHNNNKNNNKRSNNKRNQAISYQAAAWLAAAWHTAPHALALLHAAGY